MSTHEAVTHETALQEQDAKLTQMIEDVAKAARMYGVGADYTVDLIDDLHEYIAELRAPTHKVCSCCTELHAVRELIAAVPGEFLADQVEHLLRAPKAEAERIPPWWVVQCRGYESDAWETLWASARRGYDDAFRWARDDGSLRKMHWRIVGVRAEEPAEPWSSASNMSVGCATHVDDNAALTTKGAEPATWEEWEQARDAFKDSAFAFFDADARQQEARERLDALYRRALTAAKREVES